VKKYTVVACFLALFIVTAFVTTPHMSRAAGPWYVAPSGSDGNDCLNAVSPCASINATLNKPGFVAGDTVLVATGIYTGSGSEVVLLDKDAILSGGWNYTFTTRIGKSTIDGQGIRRGVTLSGTDTSTIEYFSIQNGFAAGPGGGGGIRNDNGNLTISSSVIANCDSIDYSSGISNHGTLTLATSAVTNNSAGGINNDGQMKIINSTISGNSSLSGGGIFNNGTMTITNSALLNNTTSGSDGGAIHNGGTLFLDNSTLAGNKATFGGGIRNYGTVTVNSSTISGNQADYDAGGINNDGGGDVTLRNTILANNADTQGSPDCSGGIGSAGYNLIGNIGGCGFYFPAPGDLTNVNPTLGSLAGQPAYYPLLPGSPAINAGNPTGCMGSAGLLTMDERGFPRLDRCDIGAYEVSSFATMRAIGTFTPGTSATYQIILSNPTNTNVTGVSITDTLPISLSYVSGTLTATNGNSSTNNNTIYWNGTVSARANVTITFAAGVSSSVPSCSFVLNTATVGSPGFKFDIDNSGIVPCVCNLAKNAGNPVISVGPGGSWDSAEIHDPTVLKDGNTYKMWYSGSNNTTIQIGYATSSDGITWAKYGSNPVLVPSLSWEGSRVYGATVISDTGIYKVWYAGSNGTTTRIGYATSPDGITWTKYGSNSVLDVGPAGSWDDKYVSRPSVIKIGATYHLWYTGNDGITDRVGHATSFDGITWVKDPANPVLDIGAPGAWDWIDVYAPSVVAYGDKYLMWYSGGTLPPKYQTGFAISNDGVTWTRQTGLISQGAAGSFDSDSADYPAVILEGDQFKIWYSGLNSSGTYNIGYGTAQVCSPNPTPPGSNFVYLPLIFKPSAPACTAYYVDNFSNPTSGWYTGENSAAKFAYTNGEYQVWIKNPNDGQLVTPGAKAADFTASVSARRTSGASGAYGLVFGINEEWSQFYEVLIDANAFSVWRYNNGWTALQNWTTSSAIATGTNWNRLKVVRDGSLITVYINGQQVASISDGMFTGLRRIGVTAESYNVGVDARFDDFALYPANCGSQVYRVGASIPFELGRAESRSGPLTPRARGK
jgi:uncharacterized repeat protein (TIGR01451 family)